MSAASIWYDIKYLQINSDFQVNWDHVEEEDSDCPRTKDQADAEFVCRQLGIELHIANFVKEYWNMVFADLINGYRNGHTIVPGMVFKGYKIIFLFRYHPTAY